MKGIRRVSALMLERYRLGEVSGEEREVVEAELSTDREFRLRCDALDDSDRELRRLYPWEQSSLKTQLDHVPGRSGVRRYTCGRFRAGRRVWGIYAAALFLCMLFPALYFFGGRTIDGQGDIAGVSESGSDRAKGTGIKTELSIYLKENNAQAVIPADEGRKIGDSTLLTEGSTVQLSYMTPPGDPYYGVIFSIDGRSVVTLHYPYRRQHNPLLTTGKRFFLSEAYTLDDAPGFEMFFMVASKSPLNTEDILKTAGELAKDPASALGKSAAAFGGCEVETVTIRK